MSDDFNDKLERELDDIFSHPNPQARMEERRIQALRIGSLRQRPEQRLLQQPLLASSHGSLFNAIQGISFP
jgi:hypothetical protein